MRWQIEDFVFCDQQQQLILGEEVLPLEPILVELLSYFCQHPDKIISREELIETVWLGRTVTDSAVNRAITKLRKCFKDNPKAPRFIATFPKKGGRFIASVKPFTMEQNQGITEQTHTHTHTQLQPVNGGAENKPSRRLLFKCWEPSSTYVKAKIVGAGRPGIMTTISYSK